MQLKHINAMLALHGLQPVSSSSPNLGTRSIYGLDNRGSGRSFGFHHHDHVQTRPAFGCSHRFNSKPSYQNIELVIVDGVLRMTISLICNNLQKTTLAFEVFQ